MNQTSTKNIFNSTYIDLSKGRKIIELILVILFALLTPFVVPITLKAVFGSESFIANNSQYVVGTIVNIALIITGINIRGIAKIISIATLPSISAMVSGLIFKSASIYTVYMIPAIWLGNFALIYLYRILFVAYKRNYIVTSMIAILCKAAIIYLGFRTLAFFNVIPEGKIFTALNVSMGINQVITASFASVISFGILQIKKL